MKNRRNDPMEEILQDPYSGQEIGPDELAVHSAGLTHPDDVELEKILAEDWSGVSEQEDPAAAAEYALNSFLYDEEATEPAMDDSTRVIPIEQDAQPIYPAHEEYDELPEEEETVRLVRKGRPKWKKGYGLLGIPHIVSTLIWLALVVAIGVSLGRVLWVCCADVMSFGKPAVTAYITVTEADDIVTISQKLADANLIRYPGLFKQFAEITKKHDKIQLGTYELGSHLDYNAMINAMVYTSAAREEVELVFAEGATCAQIFQQLEENQVCTVEELEKWAAEGELKEYWFLEGVERGSKYCLEGYLAPDTYFFYTNDEPRNVLEKFLNEFDDRFTDIMRDDFSNMQNRYAAMLQKGGFDSEYINAHPLTLHQVVTVASVVNREKALDAECYDFASIFYNRLTNKKYLTMGSNATVHYAIGDYLHLQKELTDADMQVDNPYNTHKYEGFPPGPICNPGAYALYAALDPNDTNYYFYLYDVDSNVHLFSENYDAHMRKVNELGD